MSATDTPQGPDNVVSGELQILGYLHRGLAINTVHVDYATGEWEMRQFLSDDALKTYAAEHSLIIVTKEPSE